MFLFLVDFHCSRLHLLISAHRLLHLCMVGKTLFDSASGYVLGLAGWTGFYGFQSIILVNFAQQYDNFLVVVVLVFFMVMQNELCAPPGNLFILN